MVQYIVHVFSKRVASLLSEKWKGPYAVVLLSFYPLHSAIQCIRRAGSSQDQYINSAPIDLFN